MQEDQLAAEHSARLDVEAQLAELVSLRCLVWMVAGCSRAFKQAWPVGGSKTEQSQWKVKRIQGVLVSQDI
jgi:hypothetical protein